MSTVEIKVAIPISKCPYHNGYYCDKKIPSETYEELKCYTYQDSLNRCCPLTLILDYKTYNQENS